MKHLLPILLLISVVAAAQQPAPPRDTSFTVYSTFEKERKNFPFIKIAAPALPKGVLQQQNLVYSAPGGRALHADVFYPAAKSRKGYPGVLLIFGGGWKSGDKSQSVPMAQQIAARGYVTVALEYRLSPEAQYPAGVHDVKAAVRWMRANAKAFGLDTARIAVHGVSAGGQLAALAGTTNGFAKLEGTGGNNQHSSAIQAIIDIDGILAFKHPESAEGKVAAEWLGGTYEEKPEIWEEASALTHAGKNTPPTLFINSSLPRFHAGRDDMIRKMNPYGIYTEIHTIPGTPHPFWLFHPWFNPAVDHTVAFLDKVFKR